MNLVGAPVVTHTNRGSVRGGGEVSPKGGVASMGFCDNDDDEAMK